MKPSGSGKKRRRRTSCAAPEFTKANQTELTKAEPETGSAFLFAAMGILEITLRALTD
jgi:hypothetical protein